MHLCLKIFHSKASCNICTATVKVSKRALRGDALSRRVTCKPEERGRRQEGRDPLTLCDAGTGLDLGWCDLCSYLFQEFVSF